MHCSIFAASWGWVMAAMIFIWPPTIFTTKNFDQEDVLH
jgi:hypothetical protein